MSSHVMLCKGMAQKGMLCYAMLCYVLLCYVLVMYGTVRYGTVANDAIRYIFSGLRIPPRSRWDSEFNVKQSCKAQQNATLRCGVQFDTENVKLSRILQRVLNCKF